MPRFVIPPDQLPPTSSSAQHVVRFRVVSQDRNRVSDYSPIFLLESFGQIPSASVEFKITESGDPPKMVTLIWKGDYVAYHRDLDTNQHDIFVSWDSAPYEYAGRETGNSFSLQSPIGTSTVQFYVQLSSYNSLHPPNSVPLKSNILKILETNVYNL